MQGHWYVLVQLGGPLVHSVISRLILPCFMPPTFDYADQVVRWYVLVQLGGPLVHSVIPRLILPCFMPPTFDYADQVVRCRTTFNPNPVATGGCVASWSNALGPNPAVRGGCVACWSNALSSYRRVCCLLV